MPPQDQEDARQKSAMLSVYYHSLGRQLEFRGAPSIALPPAVQPMPLDTALAIVYDGDPRRHREAAWALLRSSPPPPLRDGPKTLNRRYAKAARDFLHRLDFKLADYDSCRGEYREGSNLLAASLVAYAGEHENDKATFAALAGLAYQDKFNAATKDSRMLGGESAASFVASLGKLKDETRTRAAQQLRNLQDEVGMSLTAYVNEYADTVAFIESWNAANTQPLEGPMTVYPTSSVVVQDTQTLTTTVTATTLVMAADFKTITTALDPRNWSMASDVFALSRYVADDHARPLAAAAAGKVPDAGAGLKERAFLEERVIVPSGVDPTPIAEFHNVISIDSFDVKEDESVDMLFSLARCLDTRYLWDARPGGILVDEGYVKVRPVTGNVWRVTARKVLRFADRTRPGSGDRVFDIGQSLNYLAPASLSWWLQSEMYSTEYMQEQLAAERG